MSPREALDRLGEAVRDGRLDRLCADHGVRLLGAFGSTTRAEPSEPRDLDVAVGFLAQPRLLDLIGALADLCGDDGLDVAVLDGAGPVLRARALVGVPLYEHAAGVYATEQMAALAEYWDTAWLRRLDRRVLAR